MLKSEKILPMMIETDVNIQEGNGRERAIARELYGRVDAIEVSAESVIILLRVCPYHEDVVMKLNMENP